MNKIEIGEKLTKLRGNKSREQVAFELGICYSTLQSYESGLRVPRDEMKIKIAKYYNVSVSSIFYE